MVGCASAAIAAAAGAIAMVRDCFFAVDQQHYNTARPHQGIDQRVPDAEDHPPCITAGGFDARQIRRKPILSGLINEYVRAA